MCPYILNINCILTSMHTYHYPLLQDHNGAPRKYDDIMRMLQPYLGRRFLVRPSPSMSSKDLHLPANVVRLKCSNNMDAWRVFGLLKHAENTGESKPFHVTWIHTSFYRYVIDEARKRGT